MSGLFKRAYTKSAHARTLAWVLAMTLAFSHAAWAGTCDDGCKIRAAQSYMDALLSHNAQSVPFAANARRIENGAVTGDGGEAMRADLETSNRFKVIFALRDKTFYVSGNDVFAIYSLDVGKLFSTQLATARVFERFRVVDGLITQIEVVVATLVGRAPGPVWPEVH